MRHYIKPETYITMLLANTTLLSASGKASTKAGFGSNPLWKQEPVNADDDAGGDDMPENRSKANNLWDDE
jgi:hypothetical protein